MEKDQETNNSDSPDISDNVTKPVKIRRELFSQNSSRYAGKKADTGDGTIHFAPNLAATNQLRSEQYKPFYKNETINASEVAASVFNAGDVLSNSLKEQRGGDFLANRTGTAKILGGAMDEQNVVKGRGRGRTTNMDNKAYQEHNRLLQRRRKQLSAASGEQGGSYLGDVTFDESGAYLPVSLPFLYKELNIKNEKQEKVEQRRKVASTVFVDEANRNAAKILFGEDTISTLSASNNENQWYILQLPSTLPPLAGSRNNTALNDLPCGYIGDMVIRKGGRIELEMVHAKNDDETTNEKGKVKKQTDTKVGILDMNVGAESSFHQEIAAYNATEDEFMFLGQCQKKIVATPCVPAKFAKFFSRLLFYLV